MEYVHAFFTNRILIGGLIGWASAQVLKTIIFLLVNILLSLVISDENANLKSPSFIAKINLSMKFNFNPAFPS